MTAGPKRALVVDDVMAMRQVLVRILKQLGFEQIIIAKHGLEALDKLNSIDYVDLILSDYNMPCMNGLLFLKKARANEVRHYADTPIVIVTANSNDEELRKTIDKTPFTELLIKPFKTEDLGSIVKELMPE